MKKTIFLEGLPGVGKTTIINEIRKRNLKNIFTVEEIINEKINNNLSQDQKDYQDNDEMKIKKFNEGIIIIDRGPISTLSYNQAKNIMDNKLDSSDVVEWFCNLRNECYNGNVKTIFLTTNSHNYQISENDLNGPYGSIQAQKLLESITIYNCNRYCKNFEIIEYYKENMEDIINEIIN